MIVVTKSMQTYLPQLCWSHLQPDIEHIHKDILGDAYLCFCHVIVSVVSLHKAL